MFQQRALVTGATGCLGQHLVAHLLAAGWHVRASGRNTVIGHALSLGGAEFIVGDLDQPGLAERLSANIDVVFHCAALSSPWGPDAAFQRANVEVTQRLVDAAMAHGVRRFVHVSSPSIYFAYADAFDVSETTALPRRFVNAYAASKAEAERVVMVAAARGLDVVILRPRGIFGEHDTALAPRLLRLAASGRVPLFYGGRALVDVTYAGNVADAMLLAAAPGAPTGTYNVTNGEPIAVRDLLKLIFAALGREVRFTDAPYHLLSAGARVSEMVGRALNLPEPKLLRYPLGLMAYSQTLDITAATTQLGYRPRVPIADGIRRYADWLSQTSHHPSASTDTAAP